MNIVYELRIIVFISMVFIAGILLNNTYAEEIDWETVLKEGNYKVLQKEVFDIIVFMNKSVSEDNEQLFFFSGKIKKPYKL